MSAWENLRWIETRINLNAIKSYQDLYQLHKKRSAQKRTLTDLFPKSSDGEASRQIFLSADSSSWNLRPESQGHKSFRPSFSDNSLLPWTTLKPRLTCVSDGKPLRRLLEGSKGVRLLEINFLWHDFILLKPYRYFACAIKEYKTSNTKLKMQSVKLSITEQHSFWCWIKCWFYLTWFDR
jgi:hypothetical protein